MPKEFLSPSDLLKTQILDIYELIEIVIIVEDKNLEFAVFQVVASSFKTFNNGQDFFIISFVPSLYLDHFFKKKGYRMLLPRIKG